MSNDLLLEDSGLRESIWERFWSKVDFDAPCWVWRSEGTTRPLFRINEGGRVVNLVGSRVAYRLLVGTIPEKYVLSPICQNIRCVNPDHMEVLPMRVVAERTKAIHRDLRLVPRRKRPKSNPLDNRRHWAEPGVDDLATARPDLVTYWSPENKLPPSVYYPRSGRKVEWVCPAGHRWTSPIVLVVRLTDEMCPYCGDREVLAGLNDLATLFPDIASELRSADPSAVRAFAVGYEDWECALGHSFRQKVEERTRKGMGCPFCRRNQLLSGLNDLATTHPELAAQWSPDNPTRPSEVMAGSNSTVGWVCSLGHKWRTSPNSRSSKGTSCPYCCNRKMLRGFNDLATARPDIAKEYDPSNPLPADGIVFGSSHKVKWVCSKGHRWETTVVARTLLGHGCSKCNAGQQSKEEATVYAALRKILPDLTDDVDLDVSWGSSTSARVDMFSEDHGLVIEYDGSWWHRDKVAKDTAKTQALLDAGYRVLRIREGDLPSLGVGIEVFGSARAMKSLIRDAAKAVLALSLT